MQVVDLAFRDGVYGQYVLKPTAECERRITATMTSKLVVCSQQPIVSKLLLFQKQLEVFEWLHVKVSLCKPKVTHGSAF